MSPPHIQHHIDAAEEPAPASLQPAQERFPERARFLGLFNEVRGKAAMKCWLLPYSHVDIPALHWHQDVIDYVISERDKGREVVLVTGTPEPLARACNQHLDGLFSDVMGTSESTNLIGRNKRASLKEHTTAVPFRVDRRSVTHQRKLSVPLAEGGGSVVMLMK